MILKVNNLDPIQITLPSFLCWLWLHLIWFIGILYIVLGHIVPLLSPSWQQVVITVCGVLTSVIGYIKANPQPTIGPAAPQPPSVYPLRQEHPA